MLPPKRCPDAGIDRRPLTSSSSTTRLPGGARHSSSSPTRHAAKAQLAGIDRKNVELNESPSSLAEYYDRNRPPSRSARAGEQAARSAANDAFICHRSTNSMAVAGTLHRSIYIHILFRLPAVYRKDNLHRRYITRRHRHRPQLI